MAAKYFTEPFFAYTLLVSKANAVHERRVDACDVFAFTFKKGFVNHTKNEYVRIREDFFKE